MRPECLLFSRYSSKLLGINSLNIQNNPMTQTTVYTDEKLGHRDIKLSKVTVASMWEDEILPQSDSEFSILLILTPGSRSEVSGATTVYGE